MSFVRNTPELGPLFPEMNQQAEVVLDINESSPLLAHDSSPYSLNWLRSKIWQKAVKPTFVTALSIATAIPNGIFAALAPNHASPEKIIDSHWWRSLSKLKFVHTIANGTASLSINIIMNLLFFPLAAKEFYKNIKQLKQQPVFNLTAIILGIGGAVGAALLAYYAFKVLPGTLGEAIAIGASSVNFAVYVATRYVGAAKVLKKLQIFYDKNGQTQKKLDALLSQIKPEHLPAIQSTYHLIHQRIKAQVQDHAILNPGQVATITEQLAIALNEYAETHADLLNQSTYLERFTNGMLTFLDLTFAIVFIGTPVTLTFLQKGFEGISKVGEFTSGNTLSDFNPWTKRSLGFIPGIASGIFYSNFAIEFRQLTQDIFIQLYKNPSSQQNLFAIILLLANILSASSLQNISSGVVHNEENIAFVSDNLPGHLFIALNSIGGFVVNSSSSFRKAFLCHQTSLETLEDFKAFLGKSNEIILSPEAGQAIRLLSLFAVQAHSQNSERVSERQTKLTPV